MGLPNSLRNGIVAFVVAALAARAAGGKGTKVGLVTGLAVVAATWLSGRGDGASVEFEDEVTVE